MAIEIERKFLLASDTWRHLSKRQQRMTQGYLNDAQAVKTGRENCSVRIRIAGTVAYLNIKSRELGARRQEFEYPIPVADAEKLMELACSGVIEKVRHYVEFDSHLWEIDEFQGDNLGLVIAEIELQAEDEAFLRPEWLGKEVTSLPRYYNLALSSNPFRSWSDEEKSC
jgi:adenylate cyclase